MESRGGATCLKAGGSRDPVTKECAVFSTFLLSRYERTLANSYFLRHGVEERSLAAILKEVFAYVRKLEDEKALYLNQNSQLKRLLDRDPCDSDSDSPLPRKRGRQRSGSPEAACESEAEVQQMASVRESAVVSEGPKRSADSQDNGLYEELRAEIAGLRDLVEQERKRRVQLEQEKKNLELQLYQENFRKVKARKSVVLHKDLSGGSARSAPDSPAPLVATFPTTVQEERLPSISTLSTAVPPRHRAPPSSLQTLANCSSQSHVSMAIVEPRVTLVPSTGILPASPLPPENVASVPVRSQTLAPVEHRRESTNNTLYMASTSRENLNTIVEAIRMVEGEHLFRDTLPSPQAPPSSYPAPATVKVENTCQSQLILAECELSDEEPLALTTSPVRQRERDNILLMSNTPPAASASLVTLSTHPRTHPDLYHTASHGSSH
ncbi:unnamed protein product [Cyprideis torosa]|uniref:Uncharacterized protein n=1 Tax=Cyprideis torosa TaxID=163714 RepID=A0A7R8W5P5_9CRUS|nr:unnamed protein product [Cyprideis torosa]CAG0885530.1 unnamed protein product [Cyprideis torosa]